MRKTIGKSEIGFADLYVTGFVLCIGTAQVAHLAGSLMDMSIKKVSVLWAGLSVTLFAGWLFFWCKAYLQNAPARQLRRHIMEKQSRQAIRCQRVIPLVFLVLLFFQLFWLFCIQRVNTAGDIMQETVATFLREDGIHKVNPLTGQAYVNPISLRYRIVGLPTLYASICSLCKITPALLVCHVVPLFVLAGCYLAYYELSGVLFPEHLGKRYSFLIGLSLLLWCMDNAVWLDGYAALQTAYLGTSIRGLVLVPWTLAQGLKQQWHKCVLCILAEACICQTLWGLGVCLLVTVLLYLLTVGVTFWEKGRFKGAAV